MEEHRVLARRLVARLDATELQILKCVVRGISDKGIVGLTNLTAEEVERARASMMKKLNARRTADAVRIGLNAGLDFLD